MIRRMSSGEIAQTYVWYVTNRDRRRAAIIESVSLNDDLNLKLALNPRADLRFWMDSIERWCHYCAKEILSGEYTDDHIVPISKGGADVDNMVSACSECNGDKGDEKLLFYLFRTPYGQGPKPIPKKQKKKVKRKAKEEGACTPRENLAKPIWQFGPKKWTKKTVKQRGFADLAAPTERRRRSSRRRRRPERPNWSKSRTVGS